MLETAGGPRDHQEPDLIATDPSSFRRFLSVQLIRQTEVKRSDHCYGRSAATAFQSSCARSRFPRTCLDSSEARKTNTSVTSFGSAHCAGSSSGSAARCIAVFIFPGSTQLTRTPVSSNSDAQVCDIPSRPNLEIPYAPQPG